MTPKQKFSQGQPMNKICRDISELSPHFKDGLSIMVGGFGLCGNPENLIKALYDAKAQDLTIISNNCGTTELGLGILLKAKRIKKMIASYVGENKIFESQFLQGELEVELVPQGTLAEKIRAFGAGIPAFYTATGVHTLISEGGLPMLYDDNKNVIKASPKKELRKFQDKAFVLEEALGADIALIKAQKADPFGNLIFNKTARNFNPIMATAAKLTLVEAEEIVPLGQLDPDNIHLCGAYVDFVVQGQNYEKWIEQKTIRPKSEKTKC